MTKCDIILPVCDQYEFTKNCIESIIEHTDTPYRLIVINNGTNRQTRRVLDELDKRKDIETTIVHNETNIGWVKALNKGIGLSQAPFICFQNDDTIVTRGWLSKMINTLRIEEKFGMINPSWEGRPNSVSIDAYNLTLEKNKDRYIETDWCRGFSVLIKRSVVEKIGKVDEAYGLGYLDDVDYSVRSIEAGYLTLKATDTYVHHQRNVTASKIFGRRWNDVHERNKRIYHKRWGKPLRIGVLLNRKVCRDAGAMKRIEDGIFYLARKQHRIDVWAPFGFGERFWHTNIRVKRCLICPALMSFFALRINSRKKEEKRYNAVFRCSRDEQFVLDLKNIVDRMKEKTKESVNASL